MIIQKIIFKLRLDPARCKAFPPSNLLSVIGFFVPDEISRRTDHWIHLVTLKRIILTAVQTMRQLLAESKNPIYSVCYCNLQEVAQILS